MIPNPDFFEDNEPYKMTSIVSIPVYKSHMIASLATFERATPKFNGL
jgi:hypothetical protein